MNATTNQNKPKARFYLFARLEGEVLKEAIFSAHDAIDALHESGFIPESLMPEYDIGRDKAFIITPSAGVIVAAQRA